MTAKIQYFHVRRPSVSILKEGLALERIGAKGGLTVAYRDVGDGVYQVGIARCSPDDHYNKKLGRDTSLSKLLNGPNHIVQATEDTFVTELAKHIHGHHSLRKNIRAAVRNGGLEKLRSPA